MGVLHTVLAERCRVRLLYFTITIGGNNADDNHRSAL